MCLETLFLWRPLLSLCCGSLVGFISVQDDIIVQTRVKYTAWNPSITHLKILLPDAWRIQIKCSTCLSLSITVLVPFSTVLLYHCIFQRLISGHVTTLFIFLQKLSMAMPPCHLLSAVERGRAWKGKAKAKKIQVAGKNKIHLHPKYT